MSQIFDIVEELEKERKINKELEERIQFVVYKNNELLDRILKAIEYIEKYCIDGVENEYNTPQTVFEEDGIEKDNARIELLNILKGR